MFFFPLGLIALVRAGSPDPPVLCVLVRAGSPDPPVLFDRRSPGSRSLARHLETSGRPNGGVGRPSPNEPPRLFHDPREIETSGQWPVAREAATALSLLPWKLKQPWFRRSALLNPRKPTQPEPGFVLALSCHFCCRPHLRLFNFTGHWSLTTGHYSLAPRPTRKGPPTLWHQRQLLQDPLSLVLDRRPVQISRGS